MLHILIQNAVMLLCNRVNVAQPLLRADGPSTAAILTAEFATSLCLHAFNPFCIA